MKTRLHYKEPNISAPKHKKTNFLKLPWLAFLVLFFFAAIPEANASHGRYGNIEWSVDANNPNTIHFKIKQGWAYTWAGWPSPPEIGDTVGTGEILNFGDGTSIPIDIFVLSYNLDENWLYGEFTTSHTYANTGDFTAYWERCCKINELENNAFAPYRNEALVNVGTGNNSPIAVMPAILNLGIGLGTASYQIFTVDPDGDNVQFRLATTLEYSGPNQPSGFSVSPTGLIEFNTSPTNAAYSFSLGQLYNAAIVIEDLDGSGNVKSRVTVDFLIKIFDPEIAPPPVFSVTAPAQGSTITVNCGEEFSFIADVTGEEDSVVTLATVGAPIGAVFTPALPVSDTQFVQTVFTWTPNGAASIGNNLMAIIATDDAGAQTTRSFNIQVIDNSPDNDGDGYTQCEGDCDDNDASVNAGATEIPYNGIDEDCNPLTLDDDLDQDGFNNDVDCDDNDPNVYPGAPELCDGKDNDCDGFVESSTAYNITSSGINFDSDCGNGNQYIGNGNDLTLSWTGTSAITSGSISFSQGVDCTGGVHNVYLNGVLQDTFDSSGQCTCAPDTEPIIVIVLNPADYNSNGVNTVTISANNGSTFLGLMELPGFGAGIYANVCVEEGIPPVITCPADIAVNNDAGLCGAEVSFEATATGTPVADLTYSPESGSFFPVGITTVTATATNAAGSDSCTFTVTVADTEAPIITCPDSITVVSDPGTCSVSMVLPSPSVIESCGLTQASLSLNGDTIFDYIFVDTMGGGLDQPRPLIFGPDGNLYVSNAGANWSTDSSILRYDGSTGAFMDEFVSPGSLQFPRGLGFGSDGNLYVASYFANEVLRYDGTTGALINSFVPAGGNLVRPTGLTFGPGDDLYIAQAASNNILRYDGATGAYKGVFATTASSFNIGLKFGPDGHLYVANLGANTIVRFDGTTGAYIDDFVASGSGDLSIPEALDFGADGNLYVTSFSNGKVLSYDGSNGAFLDEVSASGIGLSAPDGLTVGPDGHLYVSNTGLDQIVRYPTGEIEIPGGINEITFSGSDGSGSSASCSYTIEVENLVPVIIGEGIVPSSIDPIEAGTGFNLSADFGVYNLKAATWYFSDDGEIIDNETDSEMIIEAMESDISAGVVSSVFNFNAEETGVYTVKLVVVDECGVSAEASYNYVVIYDPSGGFVTGGGWIDSPDGALVGTDYTGKANFGLVAKYKTGNNNVTLDGNTNFQFKEGDFHFKSNIYSEMSLVISGERKATYKGSGSVNGSGYYDFMVVVIDGEAPGAGPNDYDSFRIKIWTSGSPNDVVYDNEIGAADNADDATVLGGGQIVIHKPKDNNKSSTANSEYEIVGEDVFDGLELVSWPNPTKDYFNVKLQSKNTEDKISIQVFDLNGRIVSSQIGDPNKEYRIGTSLQAGLYIINVTQGVESKQIKLIKY